MASKAHQFIMDLIARKMNEEDYEIVSFEGKNFENLKYKLPPTISRHRPDLVGYNKGGLILGEAKTKNDLSRRTREQITDFVELTKNESISCSVIFGFPLSILTEIKDILKNLNYQEDKIYLLSVPDSLLPNE